MTKEKLKEETKTKRTRRTSEQKIEDMMGSSKLTTEQLFERLLRARPDAYQMLKERDDIPLDNPEAAYTVTQASQRPKEFVFDYDVKDAENAIKQELARRMGAARTAQLKISINYDDMTWHFEGYGGNIDSGTLKMPIDTIINCGIKVMVSKFDTGSALC